MGIDQVGIDKVGIDKVGIDKVGIDKVGINPELQVKMKFSVVTEVSTFLIITQVISSFKK